MKQVQTLREGWAIRRVDTHGPLPGERVAGLTAGRGDGWLAASCPAQVQEILAAHGLIDPPAEPGKQRSCLWVAESDWVYRLELDAVDAQADTDRLALRFQGLDCLADVYLDGELLASHRDMYLPLALDVTGRLAGPAVLLVHFHSPHAWIESQPMPPHWQGRINRPRLLRKPLEDFNEFNGAHPYYTPVGIYRDVLLERIDLAELAEVDLEASLTTDLSRGRLRARVVADGVRDADLLARVIVRDAEGVCLAGGETSLTPENRRHAGDLALTVDRPRLWWPNGYGEPALYEVETVLASGGEVRDRDVRAVGFRTLRMDKPFDLRVNGVPVKLWGANLTPVEGVSHCPRPERTQAVLDWAVNAHMTTIRAWGPGAPYDPTLYEQCDRRGLLVWSEFYHTWGEYPDDEAYLDLCRQEAEHHVRTLKHHPCIYMWCGGNEVYMGWHAARAAQAMLGRELFERDYPAICARLDPTRPYHPNSPSGGAYPNDPSAGDSHSYTHENYLPGEHYPVMFSENTRSSTPPLRSLRRILGDRLWPAEGFDGRLRHWDDVPLPPAWRELTLGWDFHFGRPGELGDFYDTDDTPAGLIYRLGAAHCRYLRHYVERYRRGRPSWDLAGPRRTLGHYYWKLNDTWPMIYCTLLDYFIEPTMAYYALRRAYAPILLSLELGDRPLAWLINDTPTDVRGQLRASLYSHEDGRAHRSLTAPASMAPGASGVVMDLSAMGMIHRRDAIGLELRDEDGRVVARTSDFADIERHLAFPPARLTLARAGDDAIEVSTDRFARCVELTGDADGDEFGWGFEDNYFDLLPGQRRRVTLRGRHRRGIVRARGFWSPHEASLALG